MNYKASAIIIIIFCALTGLCYAQPQPSCRNVKIGQWTYDLSWWFGRGPYTGIDTTGVMHYTYGICTPLGDGCPNTVSSVPGHCVRPGSAQVCETWSEHDPRASYSLCAASALVQPQFQQFTNGRQYGVSMIVGGGDETRSTKFAFICGENKFPEIMSIDSGFAPDFNTTITIGHCSGCEIDDANWCGNTNYGKLDLGLNVAVKNAQAPSAIAVLPSIAPLTSTIFIDSDGSLSFKGTVAPGVNGTVSFGVISPEGVAASAHLSFPTGTSAVLTLTSSAGKKFPCGSGGKTPIQGNYLHVTCPFPGVGTVDISGTATNT